MTLDDNLNAQVQTFPMHGRTIDDVQQQSPATEADRIAAEVAVEVIAQECNRNPHSGSRSLGVVLVLILANGAAVVLGAEAAGFTTPSHWVRVSDDKHRFVWAESGRQFVPWGFNYDPDEEDRLRLDRILLGEDARAVSPVGDTPGRHHAGLAGVVRAEIAVDHRCRQVTKAIASSRAMRAPIIH